jgi:hypothetical protein
MTKSMPFSKGKEIAKESMEVVYQQRQQTAVIEESSAMMIARMRTTMQSNAMHAVEQLSAENETRQEVIRTPGRKKKKKRPRIHHKQEQQLMNEKRQTTIIAFGDASFNHASKGYPPAPRRLVLRNLLVRLGVHVLDIDEYNSSQVCSKCHRPMKLIDAGGTISQELDQKAVNVTEKYFVRRCYSCRTIWGRDHNACRNMIHLGKLMLMNAPRPQLFSVQLPEQQPLLGPRQVPRRTNAARYVSIDPL